MNFRIDEEIVSRIREELFQGCVSQAEDLVSEIHSHEIAREMRTLIREYEQTSC